MPKRGLNKVQTRLKGIPTHQGPFGPENEEGKWKEALHPGQPLQQHPAAHQRPGSKAQTALWQQHLAAAPCKGTRNPAPKRKHATLPILEVITPIASLSGAKKTYTRKKSQPRNYRSTMEKASWRAGKTAIMYDWVQMSNHKIWIKLCFVWRAPIKMRLQQEDAT
jgi:hypothetical protein